MRQRVCDFRQEHFAGSGISFSVHAGATMSFAYTIDIQLTDLGFSDVLQTSEPPVRAGSLAASDFQTQTPTKPTTVRQVEPEAPRQPDADRMQFVGAVADGGLVVTPGAQSTGHLAGGGRAGDQPHEEAGNEGQEAKNAEESTDDSEDYDESLDENQDVLDDGMTFEFRPH